MSMPTLYHAIADAESAVVRRYIADNNLVDIVRFRNIAYGEVESDRVALGSPPVPAITYGTAVVSGSEKCIALLQSVQSLHGLVDA